MRGCQRETAGLQNRCPMSAHFRSHGLWPRRKLPLPRQPRRPQQRKLPSQPSLPRPNQPPSQLRKPPRPPSQPRRSKIRSGLHTTTIPTSRNIVPACCVFPSTSFPADEELELVAAKIFFVSSDPGGFDAGEVSGQGTPPTRSASRPGSAQKFDHGRYSLAPQGLQRRKLSLTLVISQNFSALILGRVLHPYELLWRTF